MRKFRVVASIALILIAGSIFIRCTQTRVKEKKPKTVFIILDGIPADVIEKLNPSALEEISKAGGFTRSYVGGIKKSYNETPTISAPGYISLLTGTWANKHNVWDNDVAAPNYNYWNVFRIAEKANAKLHTALFSTWLDNRTKLVGEGLQQAGNITLDYKFDGLEHDTVKYPHDDAADYIRKIDEDVSVEAARYISAEGPDLSWVYLEYTDDMGHRFGDSPQFHQAITNADFQVKRIWEAIKLREQKFNEDWLLIVTTDHGRDLAGGKDHGGQSDRERSTWIVTNSTQLNDRFKERPGIVDILPSIFNHMKISIQEDVKKEIDGVPFIGPIDLSDLTAVKTGDNISLRWKNFNKNKTDKIEIFIAETNRFKEGKVDNYQKIGEAPLSEENYNFTVESNSEFYKVLVKGPNHYANVWIVDTNN
ncbi:MAG TPA: alkaline phosphatase family protein [Chryseolinea sp.]|nr:alkaline phosphatase family protein [Chryseolinea sp.]